MSNSFHVDVSPEMTMYKWLQNHSYSVYSALSEFVDNSVQSYIDKKKPIQIVNKKSIKLKVKISIDSIKKEITVLDNAGGISRRNFQRAIKMDTSVQHKKGSLSKYGVGMKTAAIWFSSDWQIETSALNSKEKLSCTFNLHKLLAEGSTKIPVFSKGEKEKNHYTKIIIRNSKRIESEEHFEKNVIPHLEETYIKFRDFLSIEVKYNNKILSKKWKKKNKAYFEPTAPLEFPLIDKEQRKITETKRWKKKIELIYKNRQVKGFFMIMKTGSYEQPGLRLFRNNRVIEGTLINPNRPKILFGTENKYGSQRFYGELHLNNFETDFMKTKFNENLEDLYSKLREVLSKEKFFDQVKNFQPTKLKDTKEEDAFSDQLNGKVLIRKDSGATKTKTKSPRNTTNIQCSEQIQSKLKNLNWKKLYNLYNSICTISLKVHPYLSYVGSWAFLECLAAYMNKEEKTSFKSFYDGKINQWYSKREEKKRLKDVIQDIDSKGNASKHDSRYELEDAMQLNKDFKILEKFIIKCIDTIEDD